MKTGVLTVFVSLAVATTIMVGQSAPATTVSATNDTGTRPYTPYSTGAGNINLANGNLTLEIPLLHLPGRAGNVFNLSLQYDSKNWVPHYTVLHKRYGARRRATHLQAGRARDKILPPVRDRSRTCTMLPVNRQQE